MASELAASEFLTVAMRAQRRAAYAAGYDRAIVDVLAAAVYVAETALRGPPVSTDARFVLYRFVASLEAETRRLSRVDDMVSDGLGI